MPGYAPLTFVLAILLGAASPGARAQTFFHYNQVGYLRAAEKLAVIRGAEADTFHIINEKGEVAYSGRLSQEVYWENAGQHVRIADFNGLTTPGIYRILCAAYISGTFKISENALAPLVRASAKYYYFHRASTDLPEEYAGPWHRPMAHPDTATVIHQTAATTARPAGTRIRTPKGWYDAGDYNKYIVNSGITTFTLLRAFEAHEALFDTLTWNIPESNNAVPDLLDEIRWNLEWMLTMQDPDDGGVYHKNTTAGFEGFVPPHDATATRYVVQKSTAATLDFAAVMARAARAYFPYDPAFAARMRRQAIKAWEWATRHPDVLFANPEDTGPDGPAVSTGTYGDRTLSDEFFWAAAELYLTSHDKDYREFLQGLALKSFRVPSWGAVETLGLIALSAGLTDEDDLKDMADQALLELAEDLHRRTVASAYHIPLDDFRWGSSSDILNQGMVLLHAWRLSGNDAFRENALSCLDYVLGRNAPGISFVTGFGNVSPMNPHHRPSASDNVPEPIPGMLAGGPNPNNMDQDCGKDRYPDHHPAMAYIDEECSYSTNEVAINWNAPLVYLSAGLLLAY